MLEQMKLDLDTLCGKTSPEPSAQTAAKTSARCSKKSAESSTKEPMFLDLTRGGGGTLWRTSGAIMGDGYSVAWRVLDAQFWGVPQRRRRIALIADFGGSTAPEILFVSNSLSGRTQAGRTTRQGTPADIEGGTGTTIGFNYRMGSKAGSVGAATEQSGTLKAGCNDHAVCLPKPIGFNYTNSITAKTNPTIDKVETLRASGGGGAAVCIPPSAIGVDPYNGAVDGSVASTLGVNCGLATGRSAVMQQRKKSIDELNDHTVGSLCAADAKWVSNQTLAQGKLIVEPCEVYDARGNGNGETVPTITGDHNNRITDYTAVVAMHPTYCLQGNGIDRSETAGCNGKGIKEGVCYTLNTIDRPAVSDGAEGYIVRRLTPLECERLQGFPDGWTGIGEWIDEKGKTRQTTDAVRYKALGNSIAIPPWKWVLKRLCAYYERDATMASLFDGIGGFPLIWEQLNGCGSCLWASEIEEFPLAVTKKHFQGVTA